eukprot:15546315-Heterocapsa_arctica.AAC.1
MQETGRWQPRRARQGLLQLSSRARPRVAATLALRPTALGLAPVLGSACRQPGRCGDACRRPGLSGGA